MSCLGLQDRVQRSLGASYVFGTITQNIFQSWAEALQSSFVQKSSFSPQTAYVTRTLVYIFLTEIQSPIIWVTKTSDGSFVAVESNTNLHVWLV